MASHKMVFRYDDELRQALEAIKDRDGVPFHEQVRRAVVAWVEVKGVEVRPTPLAGRQASAAARLGRLTLGETVTAGPAVAQETVEEAVTEVNITSPACGKLW